ncbi:MAG TPA: propionate catabolism operon regulatory protein PrpR [Thermoguttaceae bacterium]
MSATSSTRPRICIMSHIRASRMSNLVIRDYEHLADIRIINKTFDDALNAAKELENAGEVDVFLSAGSNGEYLRNNVSAPLVLIKITGFDILNALLKARRISNRIAIVTYKHTIPELESIKQLLSIELEQKYYLTIEDVKYCFRELADMGYKVIVGGSIITELAEQHGLAGVYMYSVDSIRHGIEDAIQIARFAKIEENRRERLNTILHNLNEGVVSVDTEERIQCINPSMEKLLNITNGHQKTIGMQLSKISDLNLQDTLKSGLPSLNQIQKIGYRTVVTSRIPIYEQGIQTGAVLTFQDSTSIQQVDRIIRSQRKGHNFSAKYKLSDIIGDSIVIKQAKQMATQYAKTNSTIIITGETGTGKELIAQGIHSASSRKDNPFVAINCASFPDSLLESELFGHEEGSFSGSKRGGKLGLFEAAHTGTIFLDEVGDMSFPLQTRLLRVLQEKEILRVGSNEPTSIDIRVIAATHRDLKKSIANGSFREDLYYRINILCINLPALRERIDDISLLSKKLLNNSFNRIGSNKVGDKILKYLLPYFNNYHWPGNIRELENVLDRMAHYYIDREDLDTFDISQIRSIIPEIFHGVNQNTTINNENNLLKSFHKTNEMIHINRLMTECEGNYSEVAKRLGISRTTLWRKLSKSQ